MTLEAIEREIRTLSMEERKQLILAIVASMVEAAQPGKPRSLLELEGLGAEIWAGVDAQEYVNQLRSEWDDRP